MFDCMTSTAALAHMGERQTEVHFMSSILCGIWRYCVRSTEAAFLLLLPSPLRNRKRSHSQNRFLSFCFSFFWFLLYFTHTLERKNQEIAAQGHCYRCVVRTQTSNRAFPLWASL